MRLFGKTRLEFGPICAQSSAGAKLSAAGSTMAVGSAQFYGNQIATVSLGSRSALCLYLYFRPGLLGADILLEFGSGTARGSD